jgi:tetracycline repressor-like protein
MMGSARLGGDHNDRGPRGGNGHAPSTTKNAAFGLVPARSHVERNPPSTETCGAILRAAASLATVDGLEGLSIGNLAAAIGMSKSGGLYAHFGSKQELQLATVEAADQIFQK